MAEVARIDQETTPSIVQEINNSKMQKSPDQELRRVSKLELSSIDKSVQTELQTAVSPEIMRDCLEYWSGINVMGGGTNPMVIAGREVGLEMIKNGGQMIKTILKDRGVRDSTDPARVLEKYCEEEDHREQDIRLVELATIDKIGANRIRLHFDETLTHLSIVERLFDDDGNIRESEKGSDLYSGFVQLAEYIKSLENRGVKVEITLGPGVKHSERTTEKHHMYYSVTEYELPTEESDRKVWERYCKGIARNFPKTDLTVWIEPNFDAFVKNGRDPVKYAETVCTAAKAAKEVDSTRKVGINMLFLDQSFALETLRKIEELGYTPEDLVGYVTFNPYRFEAPEAPTWTEGARNRIFRGKTVDDVSLIEYKTYENEVKEFYKRLSKYGINDIRVGESGYEGDGYSPHQNAVCNIRCWVLDRYLWIRETPWRAIQKRGSGSNRGLVSEKGIPTENFFAYKHFSEIFTTDVVPVGELTDPIDKRVYCKVFKNKSTGEDIVVLWTAQTYDPSKEIYQRNIVLDVPDKTSLKMFSNLWDKDVKTTNIAGSELKGKGVIVGEDPVVLVGNFGFAK